MKTSIAFACALFVTGNVLADPNSAAMALARKVAAKSTAAANQTDETPQPAQHPQQPQQQASPPPASPALQATMQNITNLRDDFVSLGKTTDTNSIAAFKLSLLNNLAAAAQGTKPSQKSISQLGEDLTTAISGKEKLRTPQTKLAQYVHASFNGAHLTPEQQKMIYDDTHKILATGGVAPDDSTNVVNDLKTIVTETK